MKIKYNALTDRCFSFKSNNPHFHDEIYFKVINLKVDEHVIEIPHTVRQLNIFSASQNIPTTNQI
jgi:hypothetical protein